MDEKKLNFFMEIKFKTLIMVIILVWVFVFVFWIRIFRWIRGKEIRIRWDERPKSDFSFWNEWKPIIFNANIYIS